MESLRIVLVTHPIWNLPSTLIRMALPQSALHPSKTSHAIIVDGEYGIEAKMLYLDGWKVKTGVRRVLLDVALKGATIINDIEYAVPDANQGLSWAREQEGKPYDWKGALGLFISPFRNWNEDDSWYCYELAAQTIHQSGRKLFSNVGGITGRELVGVNPA
jgi:hypothetical protein